MLRDEATVRGAHAERSRIGTKHVDHRRDRVRHVVVPGSAGERQPAGDRERAARIVVWEPEFRGGDLYRGREARVEVEMVDVVGTDAGHLEDLPADRTDCGRRMQVTAVGERVRVVGVGTAVGEHPTLAGHAGAFRRLGRTHEEHGALLDVVVRVHELRIREADPTVVGRRRADLLRRVGLLRPCVGVASGDLAEPRPQLRDLDEVVVDRAGRVGAERLFEHRVHLHRHHDPAVHLGRVGHGELTAHHLGFGHRLVLHRPRRSIARGSERHPGAPGLGAADQHDVVSPCGDVEGCSVDQRLGVLPPGVLTAVCRGEAPIRSATRAPGSR